MVSSLWNAKPTPSFLGNHKSGERHPSKTQISTIQVLLCPIVYLSINLSNVRNNSSIKLAIHDSTLQHLRHGNFLEFPICTWHVHIDCTALGRCDFDVQAFLRQVNLSRITRINLDHWCCTCNLQLEARRFRNGDGCNHRIHEHWGLVAIDLRTMPSTLPRGDN